MRLIATISIRNLLRQKRRNFLLGSAIAFGVTILIVANGFSAGITDVLLNKIVTRVAGHVSVNFNERGGLYRVIFRDKERMMKIIKDNSNDIREIDEAIGVFARAIGKGKSDNVILIGIDTSQTLSEQTRKEVEESFRMLHGKFTDLERKDVENPIIISKARAEYLNVGMNDIVPVRFTNLFGNNDSARLTIVGIFSNDNVFMEGVTFSELPKLKKLMGYQPHEIGNLNITIENPQTNAIKLADKLQSALTPGLAVIYGKATFGNQTNNATLLGFKADDASKQILEQNITFLKGDADTRFNKTSVWVNSTFAKNFSINPGDTFWVNYENKFGGKSTKVKLVLDQIFEHPSMDGKNVVFASEVEFYEVYYTELPNDGSQIDDAFVPTVDNPLYPVIATEWILLPRTSTTEEMQKKMKDIARKKWKGTTVDVRTMYESASQVLQLEGVLNLITLGAVLLLFFIILIGVVNTLRMTIRERTREIGTIRAIGMQKKDVRNTFVLEFLFLALAASLVGIVMSFIIMGLLQLIEFQLSDNPLSMLLVSGHLYFKPTLMGIVSNILLIVVIVIATAYMPARKAANMSPSTALRQYE